MTQPVSYQVPAHPSGLDMRTQLNVIVLALLGDNVGPLDPPEMYPGMMWGDTTAMRLKRRTNANDAWIDIGPLDDFLGDLRSQIAAEAGKCVLKTGDTMTGALTMANQAAINLGYGGGATFLRGDTGMPGCGFVNSSGASWNMMIYDDGRVTLRNTLNINAGGINLTGRLNCRQPGAYGEIGMFSADGTVMYMRGRLSAGGMEWVNNAYNSVVASMDDVANMTVESIRTRGSAYIGGGIVSTDGNLYMTWAGDWLSNVLGGKAGAGAQVHHNSGLWEFGQASGGAADTTVVSGDPWVMVGIRTTTGPGWLYLQAVWLRNQ
ncbi:hypothetical protein [Paraburkholderia sp. MM5477-R1]|uniref:hypothetical protein n=1 Tax=Paraburkholderia sp. MM5477-R1 TaxID=2991062 RepID=UPI003D1CEBC3